MVIRKDKRSRKHLGARRWGRGNIKNGRGAGGKGGVGAAGIRKHKFTYLTAKKPWLIRKKGFSKWHPKKLKEIKLYEIERLIITSGEQKPKISLKNYKVLGNGIISKGAIIEAGGFSKSATNKIKAAGGEAQLMVLKEGI